MSDILKFIEEYHPSLELADWQKELLKGFANADERTLFINARKPGMATMRRLYLDYANNLITEGVKK